MRAKGLVIFWMLFLALLSGRGAQAQEEEIPLSEEEAVLLEEVLTDEELESLLGESIFYELREAKKERGRGWKTQPTEPELRKKRRYECGYAILGLTAGVVAILAPGGSSLLVLRTLARAKIAEQVGLALAARSVILNCQEL